MIKCQDSLAVAISVHIFMGIKRTELVATFVACRLRRIPGSVGVLQKPSEQVEIEHEIIFL